jgi:5-methylcytosine-specific restriction protein A
VKVRAALKLRSGGLCEIEAPGCTEVASEAAHRKKVGAGGRKGDAAVRHHVLSNLLHACHNCHQVQGHRHPAAAYAAGWMLREHQNPLSEPVVYRGTWSHLGDDGSVLTIDPYATEEAA